MNSYYLLFPTKQKADQLLTALFGSEDGPATESAYHALNVIGTLYDQPEGQTDGEIDSFARPIDGWHVNLRLDGALPDSLKPYEVHPITPSVVWL